MYKDIKKVFESIAAPERANGVDEAYRLGDGKMGNEKWRKPSRIPRDPYLAVLAWVAANRHQQEFYDYVIDNESTKKELLYRFPYLKGLLKRLSYDDLESIAYKAVDP